MSKKNARKRKLYEPLILAVTSGKGGVGKTTISVNLAISLFSRSRKVLVVDGDLGLANVDIMFGIKPLYTFEHLLKGEKSIDDIIVKGPGGIHLLPASSGISDLADLDADRQMMLLSQLEELENRYDVILIDTAAGIGSSVMNFSAAAQHVLLITTGEPTSLADSYAVIKVLRSKYNVYRFNLLVNNVENERAALRVYRALSNVADTFIDVVIDYVGFIPTDPKVTKAISSQKPVIELYPDSDVSESIRTLAETLLARRKRSTGATSPLFWSRILE